jgi:hypothetical protein
MLTSPAGQSAAADQQEKAPQSQEAATKPKKNRPCEKTFLTWSV